MSSARGVDAPCAAHAPQRQHKASSEDARRVPSGMTSTQNLRRAKGKSGRRQPHPSSTIRIIDIMELTDIISGDASASQTSSAMPSNAGVTFSGSVAASAS